MNPLSKLSGVLTVATFLAVPCFAQVGGITIDTGQPTYEVGQRLNFTVTTAPGNIVALLSDLDPGPVMIPGIGELHVGFSPALRVFPYVSPPNGILFANCMVMCDPSMFGYKLYMHAVGFVPPAMNVILSNPEVLEFVAGDCTDDCEGGIHRLGLQTILPGIGAAPGLLVIEARERRVDGALVGELSAVIDPNAPPALPLSNAAGTVELVLLERRGADLVVRFEVDARPTTLRHLRLPPETWFLAAFETEQAIQAIHTSCSVPIAVGMPFGPFTVTLLEDRR